MKCPDGAVQIWSEEIRKWLAIDLIPAQERVSRRKKESKDSMIELELRMSGRITSGISTITLSPIIWVMYGRRSCKREIQKDVTNMTWLRVFGFGIEIYRRNNLLGFARDWIWFG